MILKLDIMACTDQNVISIIEQYGQLSMMFWYFSIQNNLLNFT